MPGSGDQVANQKATIIEKFLWEQKTEKQTTQQVFGQEEEQGATGFSGKVPFIT